MFEYFGVLQIISRCKIEHVENKAGSLPSSGGYIYTAVLRNLRLSFLNYKGFNCATVTILRCLSYIEMSGMNTLVVWLTT